LRHANQHLHTDASSISDRFCAIAPRSAISWATARIALSFTACAPGIVAFWTFVVAQSDDSAVVGPITVSVIVTLLSLPASVLGNKAALHFGRHRAITVVMIASAAVALAIGLSAGSSALLLLPLVLIYGLTIPADSGALTSGTTASATPAYRGATLALHSTVGFGLWFLSSCPGWRAHP
jgi:hypothetical protein